MASPEFLIQVADLTLFGYLVVIVGIGYWALQGGLSSEVEAKYPRKLIRMSQLPFTYRWRQSVRTEDLEVFEKARVRHHIFVLSGAFGSLVVAMYGFANVVAFLWKCQLQGIGRLHGQ